MLKKNIILDNIVTSGRYGENIVFRLIRNDEFETYMNKNGIFAKTPGHETKIHSHIRRYMKNTCWISTSKDLSALIDWGLNNNYLGENALIAIDLNKLETDFYDVSDFETLKEIGGQQTARLGAMRKEVIIKDYIPQDAIIGLIKKPGEFSNWKNLPYDIKSEYSKEQTDLFATKSKIKCEKIIALRKTINSVDILTGLTEKKFKYILRSCHLLHELAKTTSNEWSSTSFEKEFLKKQTSRKNKNLSLTA